MLRKLLLSLLSALLFILPWYGLGPFSLFVAFVPLFILGESRPRYYWLWVSLAFFIWIMASTWWVGLATVVATFAVPLVGLFFTLVPFMVFHRFRFRAPAVTAWTIFVTLWISFEALYTYNEISFPWLTLGNGFADSASLVQWYSATGTFGGSAWVLIGNIIFYQAWITRRNWGRWAVGAAWVTIPIVISLIQYGCYKQESDPIRVAVIQPNIDPYYEKFESMTADQQRDLILSLADQAPMDVQCIVTPETAFDGDFWLGDELNGNAELDTLERFMSRYPRAVMIAGATTFRAYAPAPEKPTPSAHKLNAGGYYDVYNSAIGISSSAPPQVYHKSRLVCGAETVPYPHVLGMLEYLSIDLGGISGALGRQAIRTLIYNPSDTLPIAVAICYESIYGEYFTEYIERGARLVTIITNDGWWGDTQGHRHHLNYARLRAIETRRSIARSANTGISALINQRGDVVESLGWDERGVLVGELDGSDYVTFYVRFGDWVVRLSWLLLALSVLYYVSWSYKKRSLLVP